MSVIIYSLGAAEEVTGSKHVLEIDGRPILVDCGAFQGKWNESDQKNRDFNIAADKLENVILTHAHYDHCGLLPMLGKRGFSGNGQIVKSLCLWATSSLFQLLSPAVGQYVREWM